MDTRFTKILLIGLTLMLLLGACAPASTPTPTLPAPTEQPPTPEPPTAAPSPTLVPVSLTILFGKFFRFRRATDNCCLDAMIVKIRQITVKPQSCPCMNRVKTGSKDNELYFFQADDLQKSVVYIPLLDSRLRGNGKRDFNNTDC